MTDNHPTPEAIINALQTMLMRDEEDYRTAEEEAYQSSWAPYYEQVRAEDWQPLTHDEYLALKGLTPEEYEAQNAVYRIPEEPKSE